ncbi:uncharacterized protein F5891DRAFT_1192766 [Suillus fuscotomentosus]|uniref:DUF6533 domain-containing protein n=1 Tax=Suillus fuscotomentosus TaxID=1912939 RepID=A0AAD4E1B9_9AGAM|nr:uncharacterized protein F5891DRAFT_1192766 [Suillus fuscotomentosus]KAG1896659.1 hypothetical protein F5891DRAFT_1192766 [Suillus fuscotomentosus]
MVAPIENIGIQTAKYCNVASLGVLIFDYFLTLEPEIRWTWNRRWNVARVLFVISRYMAFVAAVLTSYAILATRANENDDEYSARTSAGLQMVIDTLNIQRFVIDFITAIHIISIIAAEGLLIIRTYAFWKQSKKLLAVLLVLAAICIGCGVGLTDFVGGLLAVPVNPSGGFASFSFLIVDEKCAFQAPPTSNCTFQAGRSSAIQYGFLAAYEILLLFLMVFKRYKDYRDSNSRLVGAVFQGGVWYLTPIISVSVANTLITILVPQSYNEMLDLPQLVLHSMLASRVLFSLRESDQDELDWATLQMSTFRPAQQDQRPTSFD